MIFLAPIPNGSKSCTISSASSASFCGILNSSAISLIPISKYPFASKDSIIYLQILIIYGSFLSSPNCSCKNSFNETLFSIKLRGEVSSSLE